MATPAQRTFFAKLTEERDLGERSPEVLIEQFDGLDDRSASDWIQAALGRPKRDVSDVTPVPPPFG